MQLYALNKNEQLIGSQQAQKQTDYFCMECWQRVRLRSGMHRQPHFYHCEPNMHCRLNGKGIVHLQVQEYVRQILPLGECHLEFRFPDIKRIADVAWIPQQIIFEIQCASISAEEVNKRNSDYQKLGWEVVWILHDKRYNQYRLSAAERCLLSSTHYFTNLNQDGQGIIYDQFSLMDQGLRLKRMSPLPIQLHLPTRLVPHLNRPGYPDFIQVRLKNWKLSFKQDLIDTVLYSPFKDSTYLKMKQIEQAFTLKQCPLSEKKTEWIKKLFHLYLLRPWDIVLKTLLEKACS